MGTKSGRQRDQEPPLCAVIMNCWAGVNRAPEWMFCALLAAQGLKAVCGQEAAGWGRLDCPPASPRSCACLAGQRLAALGGHSLIAARISSGAFS